jgi:tagaturonate epimerase
LKEKLAVLLGEHGFALYERSLRAVGTGWVFVAGSPKGKLVGVAGDGIRLGSPAALILATDSELNVALYPLNWVNYLKLREVVPVSPSQCIGSRSFGTGDRLGLATAAHLSADANYPVFPVIAQQSPRELQRTNRSFRSVLLDAVMGVLESGFDGGWGADADHIKDEHYLIEGAEAGYTMFTLDLSEWLVDLGKLSDSEFTAAAGRLSELSNEVVRDCTGREFAGHAASGADLVMSAVVYEKALEGVIRYDGILKSKLSGYDLEVSIDEGARDTTPEDHLFVAEYLNWSGIKFASLAPKFPGEFQKGVDYVGDVEALEKSFKVHAAIADWYGGYRLSLHSGSDKFSIYKLFSEATGGRYHVKTSGTTWLQAVKLVASEDPQFFGEMYQTSLENLSETKKAYHVSIQRGDFPAEVDGDAVEFLEKSEVMQLCHISYGVLLDKYRDRLYRLLREREAEHYGFVGGNIERHLKLLVR